MKAIINTLQRAAHEPLLHFLGLGLLLFVLNNQLNGSVQLITGSSVTITEGRILQIAHSYELLSGRLPSRSELQALVNDFVDEEVAYREAMAMGLDIDDTIVRRRMRQKLTFLSEDTEVIPEQNNEQLSVWLANHGDEFQFPQRIAFRQVLASSDTRGLQATADAKRMLAALTTQKDPQQVGDTSMLPATLPLTSEQDVAAIFGTAFATQLFKQTAVTNWFGPVTSPFGAHLLQILSVEPAHEPILADIREQVRVSWIEAKRVAKRDEFQRQLRERYTINIEWPADFAFQGASQAPLASIK